jgi:hypothetical protein
MLIALEMWPSGPRNSSGVRTSISTAFSPLFQRMFQSGRICEACTLEPTDEPRQKGDGGKQGESEHHRADGARLS